MKPAVIVSLLVMMFAFLTMVTETVGKPANKDEQGAGAKRVTFYQKNLQSDSQMNLQKRCQIIHFCGRRLTCHCGRRRSADENVSGAKKKFSYDIANEDERVAEAKDVTSFYKKNLQLSDSQEDPPTMTTATRPPGCLYYIDFCGWRIWCCLG